MVVGAVWARTHVNCWC